MLPWRETNYQNYYVEHSLYDDVMLLDVLSFTLGHEELVSSSLYIVYYRCTVWHMGKMCMPCEFPNTT